MQNTIKKFNILANTIIIILGVIIAVTVVKRQFFSKSKFTTDKVQQGSSLSQTTPITGTNVGHNSNILKDKEGRDTITVAQIELAKKNGQHITLLDIRSRTAYGRDGITGAKNIPIDELHTRALNELSLSDMIVPYCRCRSHSLSILARKILNDQGYHQVLILKEDN